VINPLAYRAIPSIERWLARRPRLWRLISPPPAATHDAGPAPPPSHRDPGHRAVVVGYGPTGRTVTRLLRENGIEPTVIELNVDTLRELRENGVPALYGDATHRETLAGAGVGQAGSLILTSDGIAQTQEVIRAAREMNPQIHVLARTPYLRSVAALYGVGANGVFSGEGEVALALTEALLRRLGATPDQIDRERGRVHTELADLSSGTGAAR
jgi:CPA2 family monovalent cation:H+ antiporter-2